MGLFRGSCGGWKPGWRCCQGPWNSGPSGAFGSDMWVSVLAGITAVKAVSLLVSAGCQPGLDLRNAHVHGAVVSFLSGLCRIKEVSFAPGLSSPGVAYMRFAVNSRDFGEFLRASGVQHRYRFNSLG